MGREALRRSWEHALRGGRRRVWTAVLVWPALAGLVAFTVLRLFGLEGEVPLLVVLVSFTPYAAAAGLVLAVTAGLARRAVVSIVAVAAAAALAVAVLPRAFAAPPPSGGTPLVVMSVNLRLGGADADSIVDLVRTAGVDVLAVQELTPQAQLRLDEAGITRLLPYRESHPQAGADGSGLFSRLPLASGGVRSVSSIGFTQAYASVGPVGERTVVVESVHPVPPLRVRGWSTGLRSQPPAGADPPRILAGDFNATLDHAALRALLATGYRDAADAVGRALTPTWPYYGRRSAVTPKVALDHILVPPGIGVRDFRAVTIPRTDHRAVVATLVL